MKHCPNDDCSHLAETGRAGEFRDDIESCTDCGTSLAAGEPPEPEPQGAVRWIPAMVVPHQAMASMAKRGLMEEGIPCEVRQQASEGGGIVPGQAPAYELMVPDHFLEDATSVLESLPLKAVALPEGDDIEFVDVVEPVEDEEPEDEEPEEPEIMADACPRCSSTSITRVAPDLAASAGILRRLFSSRKQWSCVACGHGWS